MSNESRDIDITEFCTDTFASLRDDKTRERKSQPAAEPQLTSEDKEKEIGQ